MIIIIIIIIMPHYVHRTNAAYCYRVRTLRGLSVCLRVLGTPVNNTKRLS